jgi:hypothetical protein
MPMYYISRKNFGPTTYQVVYEDVKTRTSKGYPIMYELKVLPTEYETWEEAQEVVEHLNSQSVGYPYSSIFHTMELNPIISRAPTSPRANGGRDLIDQI